MIFIGTDHGGFELKKELINYIKDELKQDITDLGIFEKKSVDYPDIAELVCGEVLKNNGLGIVICGTGIGISISANKVKGIRCALCSEEYSTRMARLHNNANVLALGGRTIGAELAKSIVKVFIETPFSNEERHKNRVCKISDIENN
jgi:ribose 5-phosphate isomerase B